MRSLPTKCLRASQRLHCFTWSPRSRGFPAIISVRGRDQLRCTKALALAAKHPSRQFGSLASLDGVVEADCLGENRLALQDFELSPSYLETQQVVTDPADNAANPAQNALALGDLRIVLRMFKIRTNARGRSVNTGASAVLRSIRRSGYTLSDLEPWAALLRAQSSVEIVSHMSTAEARMDRQSIAGLPMPVPLFLVHDLLGRDDVSASVMKAVLSYLQRAIKQPIFPHLDIPRTALSFDHRMISRQGAVILNIFLRLIGHARIKWPESLEFIALLFTHWVTRINPSSRWRSLSGGNMSVNLINHVTNTFLEASARPSLDDPFENISIQHAAHAEILRFMVAHDPPLELDRRGYQAVASVQLMAEKTPDERRWAQLKALSWPPWKEDRTRMDSLIGPEKGISIAAETLNRSMEAGYKPNAWTRVARLYAGWDTDLSPSIQYRQYLGPIGEWQEQDILWIARIRTTRTMQEAWASFLAYQSATGKIRTGPCQAMIEKILFESVRVGGAGHEDATSEFESLFDTARQEISTEALGLLPGDGKEVFPPPSSVHQETYTQTPPPSLEEFIGVMQKLGVSLDDDALSHLLHFAPDWETGCTLIGASDSETPKVNKLNKILNAFVDGALNAKLSTALVLFLVQFPSRLLSVYKQLPSRIRCNHWILNKRGVALALVMVKLKSQLHPKVCTAILDTLAKERGMSAFDSDPDEPLGPQSGLINVQSLVSHDSSVMEFKAHLDRLAALDIALNVDSIRELRSWYIGVEAVNHMFQIGLHAAQAAREIILAASKRTSITGPDDNTGARHASMKLLNESNTTLRTVQSTLRPRFFHLLGVDPASLNSPVSASSTSALSATSLDSSATTTSNIAANALPRLYLTPNPASLHTAIRCLGAADDFVGLLQVARFMALYWPELRRRVVAERRGKAMWRKAMAALRLVLHLGSEALSRGEPVESVVKKFGESCRGGVVAAGSEALREIEGIVAGMGDEWGGWPSDEVVEGYIRNRSRRRRSRT